jgi:hypothetical protein
MGLAAVIMEENKREERGKKENRKGKKPSTYTPALNS